MASWEPYQPHRGILKSHCHGERAKSQVDVKESDKLSWERAESFSSEGSEYKQTQWHTQDAAQLWRWQWGSQTCSPFPAFWSPVPWILESDLCTTHSCFSLTGEGYPAHLSFRLLQLQEEGLNTDITGLLETVMPQNWAQRLAGSTCFSSSLSLYSWGSSSCLRSPGTPCSFQTGLHGSWSPCLPEQRWQTKTDLYSHLSLLFQDSNAPKSRVWSSCDDVSFLQGGKI